MRVEIINPGVLRDLYKNHGEFACVCYGTDSKHAEKVGESCQESGHLSGSRCEYIKFRISEIDRGTAEQNLRHEIGTYVPFEYQDNYSFADYAERVKDVSPDQIIKNMASFRYIDKNGFDWETPGVIVSVKKALARYDELMLHINKERKEIKAILEEAGVRPNVANEAVNFVLPRATKSEFVIGFTPEALIHWCHKRMCIRAQEFINELAYKIKNAVSEVNPEYANELMPHCEHLLWCPEGKHSCRRMPTKDELKNLLRKQM